MSEVSKFWNPTSTGDGILAPYSEPGDVATVLNAISGCFDKTTNYGGVFQNQLNALTVSGTSSPVSIATGRALVYGTWYENNTSAVSLAIPTPVTSTRIDRIVIRKDWTAQTARITRVVGVEGGSEAAMTQVFGNQWDIPLAKVSITTGGVITLTDEREFVPTSSTLSVLGGTTHGVVIGEGASPVNITSAGSAGQVLTSNGASADPTFQSSPLFAIADTTLLAPATNITFNAIPGTYRHLYLQFSGRSDSAGTNDNIAIQFNGDLTAADYSYEYLQANVATVTSGGAIGTNAFIQGPFVGAAGDTANYTGALLMNFPDYTSTTVFKSCWGTGGDAHKGLILSTAGAWASLNAITSIKIFPQNGTNFVTGTRATLYGWN